MKGQHGNSNRIVLCDGPPRFDGHLNRSSKQDKDQKMSKLKVAKAVRATFSVAKWLGIAAGVCGIVWFLWFWATGHFLSFAVIIGVVVLVFLLAGILTAWDWCTETIRDAEREERRAQERNRVEKLRKENPDMYVPSFDDEDGLYSRLTHR